MFDQQLQGDCFQDFVTEKQRQKNNKWNRLVNWLLYDDTNLNPDKLN